MKERNILAGFRSVDKAHKASEELKQAGFETVQVDHIGAYSGEGVQQVMNPITGEITSLGYLTLSADFPSGRDVSVMAAVDPSASGMSDGGQETVAATILLTCVCREDQAAQAEHIIRANDGEI